MILVISGNAEEVVFQLRVARIAAADNKETFALVDSAGKQIATKEDIENQVGIHLPKTIEDFLFQGYAGKVKSLEGKLSFSRKIEDFRLLAPITQTFKIICLAFNYSDQTSWVRFGKSPPKDPVIYFKPRTSLSGPFDDILCPKFVAQLDYEGELALVIGKKCKNAPEAMAADYISGYFIFNDVSARDIQFIDKQYSRAKSFDTFGPCGPWLTTPDEVSDPGNLCLTTKVNGEIRQDSSTKNLVLKINRIIHTLSSVMTLEPGDIISTGTPSGTALSLSSHLKYLQNGDIVEVEIEKLGKIRNKIVFTD
jgi:2-keto-4-pentenoate hydratase/2-oxohepta-3-ene-1,7-dioic acid hydratase in catechol pathway